MENYYLIMQKELERISSVSQRPRLLLHSCCAPCSSSVLFTLMPFFDISLFFYNPNIMPTTEYTRRRDEQVNLLACDEYKNVAFIEGAYDQAVFRSAIKGLEVIPEGGERCFACYEMRLTATAQYAKENGFDYFTTTLSVSPHKNAAALNLTGVRLSEQYDVKYLVSDFKKKDGYKKSLELSAKYNLYRQDYCGCGITSSQA